MSTPIRVMCVDDNAAVTEAVRVKVSLEHDLAWVGSLDCADDLVKRVVQSEPDVILLDVDMPGLDPFRALSELATIWPRAKALMFTALARCDLVDRAVGAGAWGYLLKSQGPGALIDAIRRVVRGEFVVEPESLLLATPADEPG